MGDEISGGEGADDLSGDGGDDTLRGDEGDDILSGGAGDDELIGGEGLDAAEYGDPVTIDLDQGTAQGGGGRWFRYPVRNRNSPRAARWPTP